MQSTESRRGLAKYKQPMITYTSMYMYVNVVAISLDLAAAAATVINHEKTTMY